MINNLPNIIGRTIVSFLVLAASSALAGDLNADGKADLVWRDHYGQPIAWQMDGLSRTARLTLGPKRNNVWALAGFADVNGDGRADWVWIRADGLIEIWLTNANGNPQPKTPAVTVPSTFDFVALADVDGDSKADLVWFDTQMHRPEIWRLDGAEVAEIWNAFPFVAPEWHLAGSGDLDGDGRSDLIWRRDDGLVSVWEMQSAAIKNSFVLDALAPSPWRFGTAADLDGDDRDELVWQQLDGTLQVWRVAEGGMVSPAKGTNRIYVDSFEAAGPAATPPALDAAWRLIEAADLDGDGCDDLVFVHTDGRTQLWRMQSGDVAAWTVRAADAGMPYSDTTGRTLAPDRPHVTRTTATSAAVDISWPAITGAKYRLGFGATVTAAQQPGIATPGAGASLSYAAQHAAGARYYSVRSLHHGFLSAPGLPAYLAEFEMTDLPYWGALAIADFDGNGCIEMLGSLGDCHGGFVLRSEAQMGLGALRAPGRVYRDVRLADFTGDGIDDVIANVYSPIQQGASQVLFFRGLGNAQYLEDPAFTALSIRGFGETILVADFDNDGDLDIFLPHYTQYSPSEQSFLLINDGVGHFTDAADTAGVAIRNWPLALRVEGAQAADIDGDGWIDFYVASHLFMNQGGKGGGLSFIDARAEAGLPLLFDEGAKFLDWNADGRLDLVLMTPYNGPRLYENGGATFLFKPQALPSPSPPYNSAFGLDAADIDNDGLPDLVTAGGCQEPLEATDGYCYLIGRPHSLPRLFVNRGGAFIEHVFYDDGAYPTQRGWNDLQTFGDFDRSGTFDPVSRYADNDPENSSVLGNLHILRNRASDSRAIVVRVLGPAGQRNQQGRVVRVRPLAHPDFVMTQVLDSGSGYMGNQPYDLTFATPYPGDYEIRVGYADGTALAIVSPGKLAEFRFGLGVTIKALPH